MDTVMKNTVATDSAVNYVESDVESVTYAYAL